MHYLALQNTYKELQIALFHNKMCLAKINTDKTTASKLVITVLQELLDDQNIPFKDLSFIGVNQGPGPFTTLRVVIATANGLSFATKKPLIGINALDALLAQYPSKITTVALLNAFSHDLYFAIRKPNQENIVQGCKSANELISEFSSSYHEPLYFIGNGTLLYKDMIQGALVNRAHFPEIIFETCSLEQVASLGLEQWHKKQNISYQLQPLYFKSFQPAYF